MDSQDNDRMGEGSDRELSRRDERGRRGWSNARQFLEEEVQRRAEKCSQRLRQHLAGTVLLRLKNSGEKYYFQWSTDEFKFSPQELAPPDCTIELSEKDLLKIGNGDLNAQVAMLSDKVQVDGKAELAIYFFNLMGE